MKEKLFKLVYLEHLSARQVFDQIKILSETGLYEFVEEALRDDMLCDSTMKEYKMKEPEFRVWNLDLIDILELLRFDGYCVERI